MSFARLGRFARSSTLRLALVYAALLGVSIVALGVLTAVTLDRRLREGATALARDQFALVARGSDAHQHRTAASFAVNAGGRSAYVYTDADGTAISGDTDLQSPPAGEFSEATARPHDLARQADDGSRRLIGYGNRLTDGTVLFVGEDKGRIDHVYREVVSIYSAIGGGIFILAALAGGLFSRSILVKIARINQTLGLVSRGRIGARVGVPVTGSSWAGDEFDDLAHNVDRSLDRIETLVKDIRYVTDDIAHDLRTPLGRLRQSLDVGARRVDVSEDVRSVFENATDRVDEVLATFAAMLEITRLEGGISTENVEPVDLNDIVRTVHDAYAPTAEAQGRTLGLDLASDTWARCDRQLLLRALSNLVENALCHTPAGTPITIATRVATDQAVISVVDRGPGIPAAERANVLRRFYRLDKSRTTTGNGLGLALVSAIATALGIRFQMLDAEPGLRADLIIPTADALHTVRVDRAN